MTRFARYSGSNQKFYQPSKELNTVSDVKKSPFPLEKRNLKSKNKGRMLIDANAIALNFPKSMGAVRSGHAISRGIAAELTKSACLNSSENRGEIRFSCHIKGVLVNKNFILQLQSKWEQGANLVALKREKKDVKRMRNNEFQTK